MDWQELSVLTVSADIFDWDAVVMQQYLMCAFWREGAQPPGYGPSTYLVDTSYKYIAPRLSGIKPVNEPGKKRQAGLSV